MSYLLPIWAVFLITLVLFYAAIEGGYRVGNIFVRKATPKSGPSVSVVVAAMLGLLAFMLAFMVNFAGGLFNERRQLVVAEANAIGTAYLRAGYIDEPYSAEAEDLLREYVDIRIALLDNGDTEGAQTRSIQIQEELWKSSKIIIRENPDPPTTLYISSINEVVNVYAQRINAALGMRVPPAILEILLVVSMLTLFLVGMSSSYSERRNIIATIILVLVLWIVFSLIVDLDRSQEGLLRVPQKAMIELQEWLNSGRI